MPISRLARWGRAACFGLPPDLSDGTIDRVGRIGANLLRDPPDIVVEFRQ